MKGDTQTAYVLALSMDLLAEADRGPPPTASSS